jgi:hypothetical protein
MLPFNTLIMSNVTSLQEFGFLLIETHEKAYLILRVGVLNEPK